MRSDATEFSSLSYSARAASRANLIKGTALLPIPPAARIISVALDNPGSMSPKLMDIARLQGPLIQLGDASPRATSDSLGVASLDLYSQLLKVTKVDDWVMNPNCIVAGIAGSTSSEKTTTIAYLLQSHLHAIGWQVLHHYIDRDPYANIETFEVMPVHATWLASRDSSHLILFSATVIVTPAQPANNVTEKVYDLVAQVQKAQLVTDFRTARVARASLLGVPQATMLVDGLSNLAGSPRRQISGPDERTWATFHSLAGFYSLYDSIAHHAAEFSRERGRVEVIYAIEVHRGIGRRAFRRQGPKDDHGGAAFGMFNESDRKDFSAFVVCDIHNPVKTDARRPDHIAPYPTDVLIHPFARLAALGRNPANRHEDTRRAFNGRQLRRKLQGSKLLEFLLDYGSRAPELLYVNMLGDRKNVAGLTTRVDQDHVDASAERNDTYMAQLQQANWILSGEMELA